MLPTSVETLIPHNFYSSSVRLSESHLKQLINQCDTHLSSLYPEIAESVSSFLGSVQSPDVSSSLLETLSLFSSSYSTAASPFFHCLHQLLHDVRRLSCSYQQSANLYLLHFLANAMNSFFDLVEKDDLLPAAIHAKEVDLTLNIVNSEKIPLTKELSYYAKQFLDKKILLIGQLESYFSKAILSKSLSTGGSYFTGLTLINTREKVQEIILNIFNNVLNNETNWSISSFSDLNETSVDFIVKSFVNCHSVINGLIDTIRSRDFDLGINLFDLLSQKFQSKLTSFFSKFALDSSTSISWIFKYWNLFNTCSTTLELPTNYHNLFFTSLVPLIRAPIQSFSKSLCYTIKNLNISAMVVSDLDSLVKMSNDCVDLENGLVLPLFTSFVFDLLESFESLDVNFDQSISYLEKLFGSIYPLLYRDNFKNCSFSFGKCIFSALSIDYSFKSFDLSSIQSSINSLSNVEHSNLSKFGIEVYLQLLTKSLFNSIRNDSKNVELIPPIKEIVELTETKCMNDLLNLNCVLESDLIEIPSLLISKKFRSLDILLLVLCQKFNVYFQSDSDTPWNIQLKNLKTNSVDTPDFLFVINILEKFA
ncbi:hypothetical protein P9112_007501 [Eukaryota sp. TZLM1-RC]